MTAPLVPSDVDLRGLPWMRLDTSRLLDSDLFALSNGDEFKAAVALWCKAWTQLPAGSLPDDDRILAHLCSAPSKWKRIRAMALRGWIKCDDGRLYHPVVAEQVLAAWDERVHHRAGIEAQNQRKQRERAERSAMFAQLREAGHDLAWNTTTTVLRDMCRDLSRNQSQNGHGDRHGLDGTGRDGNISLTDRSTEGTRDARRTHADVEGAFEGHDSPKPEPPNSVAPLAIALNRAGHRCTSMNPALIAYHAAGGTTAHLLEVAAHPDCAGKPATYVANFALRELTEPAKTTTNGTTYADHRPTHRVGLADRHPQPRQPDDDADPIAAHA